MARLSSDLCLVWAWQMTDDQNHAATPAGVAVPLTAAQHRALGVSLFNRAWELMDTPESSADADDELLDVVYCSAYHWRQVGGPENLARSQWQISRAYTTLGRGEPAMHHAKRCLAICRAHDIGDWDLAYAFEALARAALTSGDVDGTRCYLDQARAAAKQIAEPEDREHFDADLATIEV